MPYIINLDALKPEFRTATIEEAENVIQSTAFNGVLIASERDLIEKFTLDQLQELYYNVKTISKDVSTEQLAARAIAGELARKELPRYTGNIDTTYKYISNMIDDGYKRSEIINAIEEEYGLAETSAAQKYARITKELGKKGKRG